MSTAIRTENLTVTRGGRTILHQLDLVVQDASVTGLIGPSGSGKTTLMRAIAGAQKHVSGTIDILGSPAGSSSNRARVCYVTQGGSVYPDLTGTQNVRHFARLAGVDPGTSAEAIDQVDLGAHADQLVSTMSGGQRARVALASALVTQAEMFLLDEPTVGLDPVLRESLWDLFSHLAASGRTLLVSSHVMDEAARCDRVLLLRNGRLMADLTPDGLRAEAETGDLTEAFIRLAERASP